MRPHRLPTRGIRAIVPPPRLRTLGRLLLPLAWVPASAIAWSGPSVSSGAAPGTGAAQAEDDVVRRASDAFGVRIGTESFGLYNESFARGFNLEAAGNYRLDGLYFVPATTPVPPTVDSTLVRIGLAALPFDFPAPSGVVEYTLRGPSQTPGAEWRMGTNGYGSPSLAVDFSIGDATLGVAGGLEARPDDRYADGAQGERYTFGLVPQWQVSERTRLRALIGAGRWRYNGDTGYIPGGSVLPPTLSRMETLGPDNARFEQTDFNLGLLLQHRFGRTDLRAGVFRSVLARAEADFTLISDLDASGRGIATLYTSPDQQHESISGEVVLQRAFSSGRWTHRVTGSLRAQESERRRHEGSATILGAVQIGQPRPPSDAHIDRTRGEVDIDRVRQHALGLSWRATLGDTLELRTGLQRVDQRKDALRADATSTDQASVSWLPNASVTWQARPQLTLYTSYVRGLEESGVAPNSARNANLVLPAVLARQVDVGARWRYSGAGGLTAAVFQIDKPTPAMDEQRIYALSGEARYRGLEASWNARLDNGLSWVLGAVFMDMDRHSVGRPTRTAVGLSERQALLGLSYTPTPLPRWSFDTQVRHFGPRLVDPDNRLRTEGFTLLDLGLRYRYDSDGSNLRLQWVNATGQAQWMALPSQSLGFIRPSTVRLIWTHRF